MPISPRYVTLCPNHLEKHPSFYLHPAKNTYTCYGCQVHGGPLSLDHLLGGTIYGQIANAAGIDTLLPTVYDLDFTCYSNVHFYPQELENKLNDSQKRFIDILGCHLERDPGI
ncbi:MAG: CHC2 zinc finger domain-containing protein [Nanoarchaeota archaeon]|nr:CHC2 zinc finger domain-containing protein [Nanoarchaeota archaeon]